MTAIVGFFEYPRRILKRYEELKSITHDIFKEETVNMSVQVEKLENNMAKLTIEVSAEELEKALDSAY